MRKFLTIVFIVLSAALGAGEAVAQTRIPTYSAQRVTPRVKAVRPKQIILPPSAAIKRAMRAVPKAQAIGVRVKGSLYIVKAKQGGKIIQIGVNRQTGAVSRLP